MSVEQELWRACYAGDLSEVKRLVAFGADIHAEEDYALRRAAHWGHLEVIKYLVECGADIHADDDYALRSAASYGHLAIVKYLCEVYIERYGIAWCLTSDFAKLREFCKELIIA